MLLKPLGYTGVVSMHGDAWQIRARIYAHDKLLGHCEESHKEGVTRRGPAMVQVCRWRPGKGEGRCAGGVEIRQGLRRANA